MTVGVGFNTSTGEITFRVEDTRGIAEVQSLHYRNDLSAIQDMIAKHGHGMSSYTMKTIREFNCNMAVADLKEQIDFLRDTAGMRETVDALADQIKRIMADEELLAIQKL